jgi:hypothetical protein
MQIKKTILFFLILVIFRDYLLAQNILFTGKVIDTKGNPVVSASVRVKKSKQGTFTDSLGIFKINLKANAVLVLSAIGFADTSISVDGKTNALVVLQQLANGLKEVVVSHAKQNETPEQNTREQIITEVLNQYLEEAAFRNGTFEVANWSHANASSAGLSTGPYLKTVNYGAMLPEFKHKEDTKGSRYLLKSFVTGLYIDNNYKIVVDSTRLLNYDKINGQLIIKLDTRNYLTVDKEKVLAFALKTREGSYIFLNVPILSKTDYFLLIANGPKYSVYKSVKTKFTKSHYTNNGLIENGNNYDEYQDEDIYYRIDEQNNVARIFELKKKSIREAFALEKEKTEEYFVKHKNAEIDGGFMRDFIAFLNQ